MFKTEDRYLPLSARYQPEMRHPLNFERQEKKMDYLNNQPLPMAVQPNSGQVFLLPFSS